MTRPITAEYSFPDADGVPESEGLQAVMEAYEADGLHNLVTIIKERYSLPAVADVISFICANHPDCIDLEARAHLTAYGGRHGVDVQWPENVFDPETVPIKVDRAMENLPRTAQRVQTEFVRKNLILDSSNVEARLQRDQQARLYGLTMMLSELGAFAYGLCQSENGPQEFEIALPLILERVSTPFRAQVGVLLKLYAHGALHGGIRALSTHFAITDILSHVASPEPLLIGAPITRLAPDEVAEEVFAPTPSGASTLRLPPRTTSTRMQIIKDRLEAGKHAAEVFFQHMEKHHSIGEQIANFFPTLEVLLRFPAAAGLPDDTDSILAFAHELKRRLNRAHRTMLVVPAGEQRTYPIRLRQALIEIIDKAASWCGQYGGEQFTSDLWHGFGVDDLNHVLAVDDENSLFLSQEAAIKAPNRLNADDFPDEWGWGSREEDEADDYGDVDWPEAAPTTVSLEAVAKKKVWPQNPPASSERANMMIAVLERIHRQRSGPIAPVECPPPCSDETWRELRAVSEMLRPEIASEQEKWRSELDARGQLNVAPPLRQVEHSTIDSLIAARDRDEALAETSFIMPVELAALSAAKGHVSRQRSGEASEDLIIPGLADQFVVERKIPTEPVLAPPRQSLWKRLRCGASAFADKAAATWKEFREQHERDAEKARQAVGRAMRRIVPSPIEALKKCGRRAVLVAAAISIPIASPVGPMGPSDDAPQFAAAAGDAGASDNPIMHGYGVLPPPAPYLSGRGKLPPLHPAFTINLDERFVAAADALAAGTETAAKPDYSRGKTGARAFLRNEHGGLIRGEPGDAPGQNSSVVLKKNEAPSRAAVRGLADAVKQEVMERSSWMQLGLDPNAVSALTDDHVRTAYEKGEAYRLLLRQLADPANAQLAKKIDMKTAHTGAIHPDKQGNINLMAAGTSWSFNNTSSEVNRAADSVVKSLTGEDGTLATIVPVSPIGVKKQSVWSKLWNKISG